MFNTIKVYSAVLGIALSMVFCPTSGAHVLTSLNDTDPPSGGSVSQSDLDTCKGAFEAAGTITGGVIGSSAGGAGIIGGAAAGNQLGKSLGERVCTEKTVKEIASWFDHK